MWNQSVVILIIAATLIGACSKAPQPENTEITASPPVDMTLQQASEHVWFVQGAAGVATDNAGFISNAAAIIGDTGITVVDTLGSPALAVLFLKKLRAVSSLPVTRVITTHYHADHIYGLQVFEDAGATIVAPAGAENYLASEQAQERLEERRFSLDPWVNDDTRLVQPDHYVSVPETIEVPPLKLTLTPVGSAHSEGDLTVFVEPDRVLLSGDVIFEGRIPFLGDANSGHWLAVLDGINTNGIHALIPGHGPAAANPAQAIALTREYLAYLRKTMGSAVDAFEPFDQAYEETDWEQFRRLPAFDSANRRNAYQVFLSMEAESIGNE